jgi:hypothetical protein
MIVWNTSRYMRKPLRLWTESRKKPQFAYCILGKPSTAFWVSAWVMRRTVTCDDTRAGKRKLSALILLPTYTLIWKTHIEYIKSELSWVCYPIGSVKPYTYVSLNAREMIYYSYFHSVMTYGLLFWGHPSASIKILRLQRRLLES